MPTKLLVEDAVVDSVDVFIGAKADADDKIPTPTRSANAVKDFMLTAGFLGASSTSYCFEEIPC